MSTAQDRRRLRVIPINKLERERSWAVYGKSGTGKTTFASTFPKPMLLLDIMDQGTESIKDIKDIDVAELTGWDDMEAVFDLLEDPKCKYQTVVLDTCTQLQLLAANEVLRRKRKPIVEELRWGTLTRQDYGDLAAMMKSMITRFRNLPYEVVFIAQERVNNVEEAEDSDNVLTPEIGAALSPSVASHLNASVSVIANTFIRGKHKAIGKDPKAKKVQIETIHSMRIGPHPIYVTKVRKPKSITIPGVIDNPTYQDVVGIIESGE